MGNMTCTPPAEEAPPEQPVPVALPAVQGPPQLDFCKWVQWAVDNLVQAGTELLSANAEDQDKAINHILGFLQHPMQTGAGEICYVPPDDGGWLSKVETAIYHNGLAHCMDWAAKVIWDWPNGDVTQVTALWAIKILLLNLDTATIKVHNDFTASVDQKHHYEEAAGGGGGLNVPGLSELGLLLGVKWSVTAGDSQDTSGKNSGSYSLDQTIKVFVVPYLKLLDYLINYVSRECVPSAPDAMDMFLHGTISRDDYQCLMAVNNCSVNIFDPLLRVKMTKLTDDQIREYGRRSEQLDEWYDPMLKLNGWMDDDQRKARKYLFDELPSLQEMLQMVGKNVQNDDIAQQFRLDEGFDERFKATFGIPFAAQGINEYWQRYFWRLHWLRANPLEAKHFFYRSEDIQAAGLPAFDITAFRNVLLEQDVSPSVQDWMVATIYQVPSLRNLSRLAGSGQFTKQQISKWLQKSGYETGVADVLAGAIFTQGQVAALP
jgi:hypothetical protein